MILLVSYSELDKRENLMIIEGYFFLFLIETICCDHHLNCLNETVQMRGNNAFLCRINKNYP